MNPAYGDIYSLDYTITAGKRLFQLVVGFIIAFLVWVNIADAVGMANGAGTNGPYGLIISLIAGLVLFSTWNRYPPSFTEHSSLNMVFQTIARLTLFFVGVVAFFRAWTVVVAAMATPPHGFEGNMLLIFVPAIGAWLLLQGWKHVVSEFIGRDTTHP